MWWKGVGEGVWRRVRRVRRVGGWIVMVIENQSFATKTPWHAGASPIAGAWLPAASAPGSQESIDAET